MRCLWLSGDLPIPAVNGRRVYSAGLADALAGAGVEVVGMGIDVDGALPQRQGAEQGCVGEVRVEWGPVPPGARRGNLRKLASRWPSMAEDRRTAEYQAALAAALEHSWDVAVIDHLQMCWALPAIGSRRLPTVHVSHNHEASVRGAVASGASWRRPAKLPLLLDARRAGASERALVAHSALVTAITAEDAARFRVDGAAEVLVLPPGYSGTACGERTIDAATPRVAVMVTNLEWHVKQTNLLRLLAVADAPLAAAGIELRIVGPVPEGFARRAGAGLRATRFVGRVDSIDGELADARAGVICEPDGGGFKLKALDYVFRRVPMVVLDGSINGMPLTAGVDYLVGATEAELARQLVALVDDPAACQRLQTLAFDQCAAKFDWAARGRDLATALARLPVGSGGGG